MNISVIIPTYNRARMLRRALDSVFAQTQMPLEVIVIDDGSSDTTASIVLHEYPQAHYYYQRHAGVSAARNMGLRMARGDWIALLDSDDAWLPEKLAAQTEALKQSPEIRLVHTNETWLRNGLPLKQLLKHKKSGGWIYPQCLPLCVISPSSAVLKRTLFDDVGVFDEHLPACEDYDLWLRICAREAVLFIEQPLVIKHGGHADQLSSRLWGLDRFRIIALQNILAAEVLNAEHAQMTEDMLGQKLDIVIQGARKREQHARAAHYENIRAALSP